MRVQTQKTRNSAKAKPVSSQRSSTPQNLHPVLQLQQKLGNQAVQRLFQSRRIQAKLTIGAPNDKYEQEADRVADQVMRMPEPKVQRQTEPEEEDEVPLQAKPLANTITSLIQRQAELEEEEEYIQAKNNTGTVPQVTSGLAQNINSLKGSGQPLPASERAFFEPRFGTDFSNVRVHTDNHAARTAQSINARAFTLGNDVVFGAGQYSPGTHSGKKLLAHELTHVVQQGGGVYRKKRALTPFSQSLQGGGQPLSQSERGFFEPRFGADFSGVRVHSDARAAGLARSVNARAFTHGRDVVFGAGEYSSGSLAGRELLAHELTHVVQQNSKKDNLTGSSNELGSKKQIQLKCYGSSRSSRKAQRSWANQLPKDCKSISEPKNSHFERVVLPNTSGVVYKPRKIQVGTVKTPIDVLVHFHGYNAGCREKPPKDETGRFFEQLNQAWPDSKKLLVVLPQGKKSIFRYDNKSKCHSFRKGFTFSHKFNLNSFLATVYKTIFPNAAISIGKVIISAHSGGEYPLRRIVNRSTKTRLPGKTRSTNRDIILFDAINGKGGKKYWKKRLTQWIKRDYNRINKIIKTNTKVNGQPPILQARDYLDNGWKFRAYYNYTKGSSYKIHHEYLKKYVRINIDKYKRIDTDQRVPLLPSWYKKYQFIPVKYQFIPVNQRHSKIVGGSASLRNPLSAGIKSSLKKTGGLSSTKIQPKKNNVPFYVPGTVLGNIREEYVISKGKLQGVTLTQGSPVVIIKWKPNDTNAIVRVALTPGGNMVRTITIPKSIIHLKKFPSNWCLNKKYPYRGKAYNLLTNQRASKTLMNALGKKKNEAICEWMKGYIPPKPTDTRGQFLNVPIRRGLHVELLNKLNKASDELYLKKNYTGSDISKIGRFYGLKTIFGWRPHDPKSSSSYLSWHKLGLAVDINYEGNPYIGRSYKRAEIYKTASKLNRSLFNVLNIKIPSGLSNAERAKFVHEALKKASQALTAYLSLTNNSEIKIDIKTNKLATSNTKQSDIKSLTGSYNKLRWFLVHVLREKNPTKGKIDKLRKSINKQRRLLKKTDFKRSTGGSRDPRKGFLDLNKTMVAALVRAGLKWGGMWPQRGRDIMHFYLDNGTIKKRIS